MMKEVLSLLGIRSVAPLGSRRCTKIFIQLDCCNGLYKPFRKARLGWQEKVALYVREQQECTELCLEADNETVESLQVKISRQTTQAVLWWVSAMDCMIRKKK